jgi:deoxyribodipyrimidine photo-lyase
LAKGSTNEVFTVSRDHDGLGAKSRVLVWVHGASLSPTDPALEANPDAPAIFVFDKEFLESNAISFARLQFIFEGAIEGLEGREHRICVGNQAEEILNYARELGASEIHTTQIPSPELDRTLDALEDAGLNAMMHAPDRLTTFDGQVKRFSAFWRKVEREVIGFK